jgi:hypothetical protein
MVTWFSLSLCERAKLKLSRKAGYLSATVQELKDSQASPTIQRRTTISCVNCQPPVACDSLICTLTTFCIFSTSTLVFWLQAPKVEECLDIGRTRHQPQSDQVTRSHPFHSGRNRDRSSLSISYSRYGCDLAICPAWTTTKQRRISSTTPRM